MDDFEDALRNIDIFCKVLVKKMIESENTDSGNATIEPIENLLHRKYLITEQAEPSPPNKHLIALPQLEEPLIDVFEDENSVKVLMQVRCKDHKVIVHTHVDGLEICKRECHISTDGKEVCADQCQKLDIRVDRLKIDRMISKCNDNKVFELDIPKAEASATVGK